jgi:hypothetical protein
LTRGGGAELGDQGFQTIGRGALRLAFQNFAGASNGFGDARFVEGLEDVVDGADVEGLHSVLIEGSGEDHVGHFSFAFDEFLEDAEAVEAGHFYVEKNQVGDVFLDEVNGFDAVFSLADEIYFGKTFEEESEFVAGGLFVVDDDGVDGHGGCDGFSIGGALGGRNCGAASGAIWVVAVAV